MLSPNSVQESALDLPGTRCSLRDGHRSKFLGLEYEGEQAPLFREHLWDFPMIGLHKIKYQAQEVKRVYIVSESRFSPL